jgi:hypothetical protein
VNSDTSRAPIPSRNRNLLRTEDIHSACKSAAIVIKLFASDRIFTKTLFSTAEIYSICRTFKNVQLESYESGARSAAAGYDESVVAKHINLSVRRLSM